MENDNEWIFDCVMNIFQSPEWEVPIADFIDENCTIFDNEDENKLQYTEIHARFVELVDSILEEQLSNLGITNDQFIDACTRAKSQGYVYRHVLKSLLSLEDFNIFKNTMKKRNMELELETLQQLRRTGIPDRTRGLDETWDSSLATYEKLVKDSLEETEMLLDLNEKLSLKEEKLGTEQAAYISSLPEREKDEELRKMEIRAEKMKQIAEDSRAMAADFERKLKIASEEEVDIIRNKLVEEERAHESAKREAERIQNIKNNVRAAPLSHTKPNQVQLEQTESQLKNFRKKMDMMQSIEPTHSIETPKDDLTENAIKERKQYLREQRQKILDAKHQNRIEQLEKYKKETEDYVNNEMHRNDGNLNNNNNNTNNNTHVEPLSEADSKRAALRKKLTQKLKRDLLREQESKTSIPEPKELESMEDQLIKAQELREEKKLKEKMMEEKMAKEAKNRAQKARKGMAGTEDW